jgi:type II secretory ATPase GspE/PulE/Tfp pilus assembly ATPase PilB-like protein
MFSIFDKIDKQYYSSFITRLKILANIKIDESRIPQD